MLLISSVVKKEGEGGCALAILMNLEHHLIFSRAAVYVK